MADHISNDLFAFLTDPASYGTGQGPVETVETHAALVFLCGRRALKIKKSVRYPYLDFSRPELRRAALRREIDLNRANAPDLYLGLIDIVRAADGRLSLGGEGELVETALEMRRFDQDQLLDRMAERGALDLALMAPLARAVRNAHASAPVRRGIDQAAALEAVIAGNIASLREHPDLFPPDATATIASRSRDTLRDVAPILRRRSGAGYVRRCHGDLHLGNIVLWHVRPTLFDALEFDEELGTIDVLYDLAFLVMDLVHRDLKGHANALLNAYLARDGAGALAGLAALALMMSVRAAVRAKVAADRAAGIARPDERGRSNALARSYLDLAGECLADPRPRLVGIGGLSGTGKSTIAARAAAELGGPAGALVVRSDLERKAIAGVADTDRLAPRSYTPAADRRVYQSIREKARAAANARFAVIVDAVHARPDEREALAAIAAEAGVPFDGLWLEAPPQVLKARVAARRGDASDADARVVQRQLALDPGDISWTRISAGGTPDETWRAVRHQLARAP